MSPHIAFGGFLHETNTSVPSKADKAAFILDDGILPAGVDLLVRLVETRRAA